MLFTEYYIPKSAANRIITAGNYYCRNLFYFYRDVNTGECSLKGTKNRGKLQLLFFIIGEALSSSFLIFRVLQQFTPDKVPEQTCQQNCEQQYNQVRLA